MKTYVFWIPTAQRYYLIAPMVDGAHRYDVLDCVTVRYICPHLKKDKVNEVTIRQLDVDAYHDFKDIFPKQPELWPLHERG